MKKRVLCILLALLFTLTAFPALSASGGAEADPMITVWEKGTEKTYNRLQATGHLYQIGMRVEVETAKKNYWITLTNYNGGGFYVETPDDEWLVFVHVEGENTVTVDPISTAGGKYMAVGTNAYLRISNVEDTHASLKVTGAFGSESSPKDLPKDYYAFCGRRIRFNYDTWITENNLSVEVLFRLNQMRPTAHNVYPFNNDAFLNEVDFRYRYESNCDNYMPTGTITLLGGTNFDAYYDADLSGRTAGAFRYLVFDNSFSGTAHFVTRNGSHIHKSGWQSGGTSLGWMFTENFGDDEYCWYQAREHNDIRPRLTEEEILSGLPEKITAGQKLPAELHDFYFDAKLSWLDQNNKDVTGKTAEYDMPYRATVTVVPKDRLFIPPFAPAKLKPAGAVNVITGEDTTFTVYYNADKRPDTVITKQPEDVVCDQVNRTGVFTVDANDRSATYQWQHSGNRADWTNLTGSTSKTLTYTLSANTSVQRMYLRCVVQGWKNGAPATLYSDVATIEKSQKIAHLVVGGFPQQPGAYGEAYQTESALYFYRTQTDSSTLQKDQFTLNAFWYEGEKGAAAPAEFTGTMREGLTYTFRVEIAPKSGGLYSFDPAISFEQYLSGKPADKVQVKNGTWIVDFEFGNLGQVHSNVELFGFVPPYQGMGMIYPRVGNYSRYVLEKAFSKGWLDEEGVSRMPSVGNVYHVELCLSLMGTADAFKRTGDKPSVSISQIRDRDGKLLINYTDVKSPEYAFGKFADGSPNDKILYVTLYFKCKEMRMYKGGSVDVLHPPKAGQPLDAAYTDKTGFAGTRLEYRVNGVVASAPGKVTPQPGDVVDSVLIVRLLPDVKMDPGAYITLIRAGDSENGVRVCLDPDYPVGEGEYAFRVTEKLCGHEETETARESETPSTCVQEGSAVDVVTCSICGEVLSRKTVILPFAEHTPGEPYVTTESPATCIELGWREEVVGCTFCGVRLSSKIVPIPKIPHSPGAPATENYVPADGNTPESWDEVVRCTFCGVELSRTHMVGGKPAVRLGDVDNDGYIAAADARLALRRAVELENYVPGSREFIACDVDKDDIVTSADARLILRAAVELEDPSKW